MKNKDHSATIVLADPQPLTRVGLMDILENTMGLHVVASPLASSELISTISVQTPTLLIADPAWPHSITFDDIRQAVSLSTATRVMIVSNDAGDKLVRAAVQSGIRSYVTKDSSLEEIGAAVGASLRGEKYFSQRVLDILVRQPADEAQHKDKELSPREIELLRFLALGYSTLRCADAMHLSPHTVHSHRKNIIRKLNIQSPTQYVLHALERELIGPKSLRNTK